MKSANFGEFAPRPGDHPILLFSSRLPSCPYEEVGLVRVDRGDFGSSMQTMLDRFRQRARDMGGDAVVGVGLTQSVQGGVLPMSVSSRDGLAGTVIRFTDEDCRNE